MPSKPSRRNSCDLDVHCLSTRVHSVRTLHTSSEAGGAYRESEPQPETGVVADHDQVSSADDRSRRTSKIGRQQQIVLGRIDPDPFVRPARLDFDEGSGGSLLGQRRRLSDYAFGEMDDDGNRNLASFAETTPRHRYNFMPAEDRLYFVSD
jgi:hypothetical protein